MSKFFKKLLFIFIVLGLSFQVLAEGKKLYTENEFLDTFGAKSKEKVLQILGEPARKEMSVKPTNASSIIGFNDRSRSSAEISSPVGITSDTVNKVAADFPKYIALANKAKASISTTIQLCSFTIAGKSFDLR